METIRYPARFTILDAPGKDALALATSLRQFDPEPPDGAARRTPAPDLWRTMAGAAARILKDVDAYVAGINAYNRKPGQRQSSRGRTWT